MNSISHRTGLYRLLPLLVLLSCGGKKDDPVEPAAVEVNGITISASTLSLEPGQQTTLTAQVSPADATDPAVTWTSSSPGIASVADGVVTAVAAGDAVITASAGACNATCAVRVTDPVPPYVEVAGVVLDRKSHLLPLGSSLKLSATVTPSDATEPGVTWTSSDPSAATVSSDGVVTALAEGIARITALAGGHQAVCLVQIVPAPPSNSEIRYVSWTRAKLNFGEASGFGATLLSNEYIDGTGILSFDGEVTGIPSGFFSGNTGLREVYLPASVREIGYQAFQGCSTLLKVHLQEGVTSLGSEAFNGCSSLREMPVPGTLTAMGSFVLRDCGLVKELVVPENVSSMGDYCLYGCTGLTSLSVLPDTPPSLGFRALDETGECPIYVPSPSLETYRSANRWKDISERLKALSN